MTVPPEYEKWMDEFLMYIGPNEGSIAVRGAVYEFVRGLIVETLGNNGVEATVFRYGSVPLMTYLPDGDIDIGFATYSEAGIIDNDTLSDIYLDLIYRRLKDEDVANHPVFPLRNPLMIMAEVRVLKFTVQNIAVDLSANKIGGSCSYVFLEMANRRIGENHLLKRATILIKCWCAYESHILGSRSGLMATYALEILVLCILHLFEGTLKTPLQVLLKFLRFYSVFSWNKDAVTICGPLPIEDLCRVTAERIEKSLQALEAGKCQPAPHLFDPELERTAVVCSNLPVCNSTLEWIGATRQRFSMSYGYQGAALSANSTTRRTGGFVVKNVNIVDPLMNLNNLGRSVSSSSFYRISEAFKMGYEVLTSFIESGDPRSLKIFFKNSLKIINNSIEDYSPCIWFTAHPRPLISTTMEDEEESTRDEEHGSSECLPTSSPPLVHKYHVTVPWEACGPMETAEQQTADSPKSSSSASYKWLRPVEEEVSTLTLFCESLRLSCLQMSSAPVAAADLRRIRSVLNTLSAPIEGDNSPHLADQVPPHHQSRPTISRQPHHHLDNNNNNNNKATPLSKEQQQLEIVLPAAKSFVIPPPAAGASSSSDSGKNYGAELKQEQPSNKWYLSKNGSSRSDGLKFNSNNSSSTTTETTAGAAEQLPLAPTTKSTTTKGAVRGEARHHHPPSANSHSSSHQYTNQQQQRRGVYSSSSSSNNTNAASSNTMVASSSSWANTNTSTNAASSSNCGTSSSCAVDGCVSASPTGYHHQQQSHLSPSHPTSPPPPPTSGRSSSSGICKNVDEIGVKYKKKDGKPSSISSCPPYRLLLRAGDEGKDSEINCSDDHPRKSRSPSALSSSSGVSSTCSYPTMSAHGSIVRILVDDDLTSSRRCISGEENCSSFDVGLRSVNHSQIRSHPSRPLIMTSGVEENRAEGGQCAPSSSQRTSRSLGCQTTESHAMMMMKNPDHSKEAEQQQQQQASSSTTATTTTTIKDEIHSFLGDKKERNPLRDSSSWVNVTKRSILDDSSHSFRSSSHDDNNNNHNNEQRRNQRASTSGENFSEKIVDEKSEVVEEWQFVARGHRRCSKHGYQKKQDPKIENQAKNNRQGKSKHNSSNVD